MSVIDVSNPSLETYESLQVSYLDTLRCPCTSTNILYQSFISLSPVFHQVCSSDFVTNEWLSVLRDSYDDDMSLDWRSRAFSQFQLLTNLCQFANQTIKEAVRRFLAGSFVTASALSRTDFDKHINTTLDEFFQSITTYFTLFVQTTSLLLQIDQPFMGSIYTTVLSEDPNLPITPVTSGPNSLQIIRVCRLSTHVQIFEGHAR